jgi:hypothetical protein
MSKKKRYNVKKAILKMELLIQGVNSLKQSHKINVIKRKFTLF